MARQTAAEKQRARLMAAATRRTEPDAAPAGRTAVRSKPVRITIDLAPEQYRALTAWTSHAAGELEIPRLTLADAVRAMAKVVTADDGVSAEVIDVIRRDKDRLSDPVGDFL